MKRIEKDLYNDKFKYMLSHEYWIVYIKCLLEENNIEYQLFSNNIEQFYSLFKIKYKPKKSLLKYLYPKKTNFNIQTGSSQPESQIHTISLESTLVQIGRPSQFFLPIRQTYSNFFLIRKSRKIRV